VAAPLLRKEVVHDERGDFLFNTITERLDRLEGVYGELLEIKEAAEKKAAE